VYFWADFEFILFGVVGLLLFSIPFMVKNRILFAKVVLVNKYLCKKLAEDEMIMQENRLNSDFDIDIQDRNTSLANNDDIVMGRRRSIITPRKKSININKSERTAIITVVKKVPALKEES